MQAAPPRSVAPAAQSGYRARNVCGIAGKIVFSDAPGQVGEELLTRMVHALDHRGPDDRGVHVDADGRAGIGMARLSIIDLATGHQPISDPRGDVHVVLNGEIYNYRELRRRLAGRYEFRTRSDTEVLLPLYHRYGLDMIEHLRGMFAFALWDARRRRLLVARDRIGQKPLYVAHDPAGRTLVFGSEIKAVLADAGVPREPDPIALDEYLTYGFVPVPRSAYRAIRKLPAGCRGLFDEDGWRVEKYWSIDYASPEPIDEEAAIDRFDELLTDAVGARLISDVPLGCFLSGGMDSAIITAVMSKLADAPVRSFTIGFPEREFSELDAARRTAEHCKTEHTEQVVDWDIQQMVPLLARHFDEPFADSSAVPTYHVSAMARRHITVALSGDGGDELLAGYNRYQARRLAEKYHRLPRLLRPQWLEKLLLKLPTPPGYFGGSVLKSGQYFLEYARGLRKRGWHSWLRYFDDDLRGELYTDAARQTLSDARRDEGGPADSVDRIAQEAAGFDPVHQIMWIDTMTYLPDDILVKVDRMSMAVSLEARAPLLDHHLIEWLAGVPIEWKLRGMTRKYLLRRLAERYFPPGAFEGRKQGFMMPLAPWLRGELGRWATARLAANTRFTEMLSMPLVERLADDHRRGQDDHSYRIWALLMLGEFLAGL